MNREKKLGQMGAAGWAPKYHGLPELQKFWDDPWAFWYPRWTLWQRIKWRLFHPVQWLRSKLDS